MRQAGRFILPLILLLDLHAAAQTPSTSVQPAQCSTGQSSDIKAAVDAYLAKMPPAQRAQSDAYFEGGYWLMLWDFLLARLRHVADAALSMVSADAQSRRAD